MRKKTRFELLLAAEQAVQDKCKQEILAKFASPVKPVSEFSSQGQPSPPDEFFEITLKVEPHRVWEVAQELAEIDGVLDVDPEVPINLDEDLALLESQEEREFKAKIDEEKEPAPKPGWFHLQTKFPKAIDYAIKEAAAQQGNYKGGETGIRVGHVDTGYTNHPEIAKIKKKLGHNYVPPPLWKRLFKPSWRLDARDPVRKLPPLSWGSHGTSSAGVLIGIDTKQRSIAKGHEDLTNGVFPFVDLIPYRVSGSVISFTNNMARAGKQAIIDGCKVITISHATLIRKPMLEKVIAESYEKGIIWVAAAGSHIAKVKKIWIYPARFSETIAVAASTVDGEPWEKTHAGVVVDICAPGYQIYKPSVTRPYWLFGRRRYTYGYSEGSTFSTPMTAAAAALWLAHHGEEKLSQYYPEPWQRVEAFRHVLKTIATPHHDEKHKKLYGAGLLDVEALIKSPLPDASILKRAQPPARQTKLNTLKEKVDRIVNKELIYHTACAKVVTHDQKNDELYKYVDKNKSARAGEVLKAITEKGKQFADTAAPYLKENPNSEALKIHIKNLSE
jgi:hypothetical protein